MNIATTDRRAPHRTDRAEELAAYFGALPGADYEDELREGAEMKYAKEEPREH